MKKIWLSLLAMVCAMACSSTVLAGGPYMGPALVLQDLVTNDANYRGVQPRLSIGYDGLYDCLYWAGEVFVTPTTLTMSDNHPLSANSLKISHDFGISFLPGLFISEDIIAYLRLGIVRSKFKDLNSWQTAGQGGVGVQAILSTAWSLRGEYIYTSYGSINNLGTPQSDQYGIGLIYKFDN